MKPGMTAVAMAMAISLATTLPATADACKTRIKAMFDGGPLDPFARPPHRLTNTHFDPQGGFVRRFNTVWQTPVRTVSGVEGGGLFALVIGSESWTGPTLEGPWTKMPNYLPDDHEAFQRAQQAQMVANLSATQCPGLTEIDGTSYDTVSYVTKTDPMPSNNNAWFGAHNTVYIDPQTQRVMRWEMTNFVSSFAPDLNKDRQVQILEYDPTLEIPTPD